MTEEQGRLPPARNGAETDAQRTSENPVNGERLVPVQRALPAFQAEAQPCGGLVQCHRADRGLRCGERTRILAGTLSKLWTPWHQASLVDTAGRVRSRPCVLGPQMTVQPQQGRGQRQHGPRAPPHWENLPDSVEASPAPDAEAAESVVEPRSGAASSVGLLVTITACLGSRAWRRMASASLWVAPLRDLPLMDRTSLPF